MQRNAENGVSARPDNAHVVFVSFILAWFYSYGQRYLTLIDLWVNGLQ